MVPARSPPPRATIQTIIMLKSELSTRVEPGIKYSRSSWRLGERRKGKFCEFCWGECTPRCTIIVIHVRDVCRLVERAARFASPARPRGGARRADRARRQRGRGGVMRTGSGWNESGAVGRARWCGGGEVDWWDRTRAEYITITITIDRTRAENITITITITITIDRCAVVA